MQGMQRLGDRGAVLRELDLFEDPVMAHKGVKGPCRYCKGLGHIQLQRVLDFREVGVLAADVPHHFAGNTLVEHDKILCRKSGFFDDMPDPFVDIQEPLAEPRIPAGRQHVEIPERNPHGGAQVRVGPSDVLDVEQVVPSQGVSHVRDDLERPVVIVENLPEPGKKQLERFPLASNAPEGPVQQIQFSSKVCHIF